MLHMHRAELALGIKTARQICDFPNISLPHANDRLNSIIIEQCVCVHACRSTPIKTQEEKENNSQPKNKTLLPLIGDLRSFFGFIEWSFSCLCFSTSSSSSATFEGCLTHTKNQTQSNRRKNCISIQVHMNMLWFSRKSRGKNVFFFVSETKLIL